MAYFVWGINDDTHEVVCTHFNPNQNVNGEPLNHFLARQIFPDIDFRFDEITVENQRVVVLSIPKAKTIPTSYAEERFIRIGSGKEKLRKYPEKEFFLFAILRDGFPTIENTESEYQDLTFEKLKIYYGAKGISLNPTQYKNNLGLYTADGKITSSQIWQKKKRRMMNLVFVGQELFLFGKIMVLLRKRLAYYIEPKLSRLFGKSRRDNFYFALFRIILFLFDADGNAK